MDITATTHAAVAQSHQERQLIAGRYRLGSFHRGDESTEVWRALDEATNQVVSLEFLRARDAASRERFVAGARRLESAPPSVMRVAGIHDGPEGTFIVFEHLVHIPVPVGWLELAVKPPSPEAPALQASQTSSTDQDAIPTVAATPVRSADPTLEVANERPTDRGLSLLLFALRTRELSLIDTNLITDSAFEFLEIARSELMAVRFDPTVITDFRAFVASADLSAIVSAPARIVSGAGRIGSIRPHLPVRTPGVSRPRPVRAPKVKAVAVPKPVTTRAPRLPGRGLRVRWGRVLTRGLSVGLIAAVLIAMPPEMIGNFGKIAGELGGNVGTVATEVTTAIGEKLTTLQPTPGLQRASFEVPPLSAYGAVFEAQAPYPTARPNGTVEWIVALRNTGSVGWYRGIDGAQASLALADGTNAGVQTTAYVGPGQVGWFVVHFPAPAQPGVSKIKLLPRIDGRGPLPDLGIYATVTVSPNP